MKPFLLGKKAASSAPLRAQTPSHAFHGQGLVKPAPSGPHVEAVKEGDKVVRLLVTCSCGERIEIDCLYPANG